MIIFEAKTVFFPLCHASLVDKMEPAVFLSTHTPTTKIKK